MRKRLFTFGLAAAILAATFGVSYAFSSYLTSFKATYPGTAGTALDSCVLCHIAVGGGGPTNPYGTAYASHNHSFAAIEQLDSDGDGYTNIVEINARTLPGDPSSHPTGDTTLPIVTAFSIPASSSSLTVPITTLTATDNVAVTGYQVTISATPPAAAVPPAGGWSAAKPPSFIFPAGTTGLQTLHAWAEDAAGNVSALTAVSTATVDIQIADTTPPTVNTFTVPLTSYVLAAQITAFTAADNAGGTGVAGYLVTETATPPPASDPGWTAAAPVWYAYSTPPTVGATVTLYPWAKDGAGNVSALFATPQTTTIAADAVLPTVTTFTIPATSTSLTISVTFTGADNSGAVMGYHITTSATPPAAAVPPGGGWSATAPTSVTFPAGTTGQQTLWAWVEDAAGNVSLSLSATTTLSTTETDSGGGHCFIATAAYGSSLDPYVRILRNFRDTFLMPSRAGRAFVTWYYRVSPPLAETISSSPFARSLVRVGLLPAIAFSALSLAIGFIPSLLGGVFLLLALVWLGTRGFRAMT